MQRSGEKPWNISRQQHFICWLEEKDLGQAELFGACAEECTRQKRLESFHVLEMKRLSFKSLITFQEQGCALRNACVPESWAKCALNRTKRFIQSPKMSFFLVSRFPLPKIRK